MFWRIRDKETFAVYLFAIELYRYVNNPARCLSNSARLGTCHTWPWRRKAKRGTWVKSSNMPNVFVNNKTLRIKQKRLPSFWLWLWTWPTVRHTQLTERLKDELWLALWLVGLLVDYLTVPHQLQGWAGKASLAYSGHYSRFNLDSWKVQESLLVRTANPRPIFKSDMSTPQKTDKIIAFVSLLISML